MIGELSKVRIDLGGVGRVADLLTILVSGGQSIDDRDQLKPRINPHVQCRRAGVRLDPQARVGHVLQVRVESLPPQEDAPLPLRG